MTDKPYDLERDAFSLMRDEPFYARMFARIDKTATTGIPTAGVRFNRKNCASSWYTTRSSWVVCLGRSH